MFSINRKINCPLARMSSLSQNCFLLIPIMVSASSEIALTKKHYLHLAENPFALAGWRILKNTFPLYGKVASTLKNIWKKWKIWFPLAGIWFVFQNGLLPNFNNGFHLQQKSWNKTIDNTDKNFVSTFPICSI